MIDISKSSLEELLGVAAKAEIEANKTYSDLANKIKNPLLKEKFHLLAYEEKKHKEVIENLYGSLYQGKTLQIPEKTEEGLLPSIHFTPSLSLAQILYQAMSSEKAAQNFYAELSKKVDAPNKKILKYLSQVEKSHFMMLKGEYVLAQNYEDYGEKEIDKVVT